MNKNKLVEPITCESHGSGFLEKDNEFLSNQLGGHFGKRCKLEIRGREYTG